MFLNRLQKLCNCSKARTREIFDSAEDLGYVKCERIETSDNAQRSTKFVMLGEKRPPSDEEDEDEED